jgi:predicted DCC family thiol-disulfide oxidoreductase YuxK
MRDHLVLFDDKCPLCRCGVARIIELDHKKVFLFSPLEGRTAKQALKGKMAYLRKKNTIIVIENAHRPPCMVWMRGRAIMRLFWILGGSYRWFAWLCYVPLLTDLFYKLIASIRLKFKVKEVPERFFRAHQDRFLP